MTPAATAAPTDNDESAIESKKTSLKHMTPQMAYKAVSKATGIKHLQVKQIVEGMTALAATQLKAIGSFKFAGAFQMKLKNVPAREARTVRIERF